MGSPAFSTRIRLKFVCAFICDWLALASSEDATLVPTVASDPAHLLSFEDAELHTSNIPKTIWLRCASFTAASISKGSQCIGTFILGKYGPSLA